jgi:hypothetical protein
MGDCMPVSSITKLNSSHEISPSYTKQIARPLLALPFPKKAKHFQKQSWSTSINLETSGEHSQSLSEVRSQSLGGLRLVPGHT